MEIHYIYGKDSAPTEVLINDDPVGTYTYADGSKYVGEWKNDKRNGQGTYTFANGDKYVGGHKDDNMHGQGTLT